MDKFDIYNVFKSNRINFIIKYLPLISLILSNLFIIVIFSNFFKLNFGFNLVLFYLILFIIGMFISIFLLYTTYFISVKSNKNEIFDSINLTHELNIDLWNIFVIILKNIFFNVLNNLFILIIIWTCIFYILYILNIISFYIDFIYFATMITIIGVFSGFFQIYLKSYKEKISLKISNFLFKPINDILTDISFLNFIDYHKEDDCYSDLERFILTEEKLPSSKKGYRPIPYSLIKIVGNSSNKDYFNSLESLIKMKKINNISIEKLDTMYEDYFNNKFEKFKLNIINFDFTETKKYIFSELFFFEDLFVDLIKINISQNHTNSNYNYDKHYSDFQKNCLNYLIEIIFNK